MNLFLSIHQFHLEYRKYNSKISQNREKRNKRKRQKRKLNSTYAQWNERQTCLKTNSVNYTRSMFLLFRTNKAKRRYCREQKRETVVEHREKRRVASRANKEKTGAESTAHAARHSNLPLHARTQSGRHSRLGALRSFWFVPRQWGTTPVTKRRDKRHFDGTVWLPDRSITVLFFFYFFYFFFLFFPHFFLFFRWNDMRKEIDNLIIVDKIDNTIVW